MSPLSIYLNKVSDAWQTAISDRRFAIESILSGAILVFVLHGFSRFLLWVEQRPGVVLFDPLLDLFDAQSVTWITFLLIYGSLVLAIVSLLPNPRQLILTVQSYILLVLFRAVLMWSIPLDAPSTTIPLADPIVEIFGTGIVLTKDLFFSGHTSLMFLLCLACSPALRPVFIFITIGVGFCVLIQHVHYTVDVLVAPFIAYASYRIVKIVHGDGRESLE